MSLNHGFNSLKALGKLLTTYVQSLAAGVDGYLARDSIYSVSVHLVMTAMDGNSSGSRKYTRFVPRCMLYDTRQRLIYIIS